MSEQRHEWEVREGETWCATPSGVGIDYGPGRSAWVCYPETAEFNILRDEVLRLSAALAASEEARGKAEAERLTLARALDRVTEHVNIADWDGDDIDFPGVVALAERVVKEGGNDGKS